MSGDRHISDPLPAGNPQSGLFIDSHSRRYFIKLTHHPIPGEGSGIYRFYRPDFIALYDPVAAAIVDRQMAEYLRHAKNRPRGKYETHPIPGSWAVKVEYKRLCSEFKRSIGLADTYPCPSYRNAAPGAQHVFIGGDPLVQYLLAQHVNRVPLRDFCRGYSYMRSRHDTVGSDPRDHWEIPLEEGMIMNALHFIADIAFESAQTRNDGLDNVRAAWRERLAAYVDDRGPAPGVPGGMLSWRRSLWP